MVADQLAGKLGKIGVKVAHHARYVALMAEVAGQRTCSRNPAADRRTATGQRKAGRTKNPPKASREARGMLAFTTSQEAIREECQIR
jgi:hypothetical protein